MIARLRTLAATAALALAVQLPGQASAEGPVLVELFTSQGCASCPPADAIMAEIADRDDVIGMALHIDYWDYIGWKDEFAQPAFTIRQKRYAYAAGAKSIYTPQIIVNGLDHVVGAKPMKLAELIDRHKARPARATLTLDRTGDTLAFVLEPTEQINRGGIVRLGLLEAKHTVEIGRGENAGHTFTYHNILRELRDVAEWDGLGTLESEVEVPEGAIAVIFVQERGMGPVLAAARSD